jgi:hypothetical protein
MQQPTGGTGCVVSGLDMARQPTDIIFLPVGNYKEIAYTDNIRIKDEICNAGP